MFCVTIQCIDGRIQRPVFDYIQEKYDYKYVDTITEPGVNKIIAENKEACLIDAIIEKLQISIKKHGSKHVFVSGHAECAGNPVEKDVQITQVNRAKEWLISQFPELKVTGLWINESWEVVEI